MYHTKSNKNIEVQVKISVKTQKEKGTGPRWILVIISMFGKKVGKSIMHVVAKMHIGLYNFFGELVVRILDRYGKIVIRGVGVKLDGFYTCK